jgi:hypothetical protein
MNRRIITLQTAERIKMAKSKGGSRPKAGQVKLSKTATGEEIAAEPQKPAPPAAKDVVEPEPPPPAVAKAEKPQKSARAAAKVAEEPPTSLSPALELRQGLARGAAFVLDFHVENRPYRLPDGMSAIHARDAESGVDFLRLANGAADAVPIGHTGGYSLKLPDAVEAAASGRPITIEVIVRAAQGADKAKFALAYSTNDVGNSGWLNLEAGLEWTVCVLRYDVPAMKNGNGDFVGILPDVRGQPGIEVCCLSVHVDA